MRSFDHLMASFPAALQPPEPLVRYFQWVASQRLDREGRYSLIDPSQSNSWVSLVPAEAWGDIPADRLATFCRTGGDGSMAALWRDDEGEIRFVHLGSGSGSVMVGVLAWNAVDFLRLLAIGYQELCWPENFTCTPMQAFIRENGDPDEWDEDAMPLVAPLALRQWLTQEFGVNIPETAAELVGVLPSYGDTDSSDPFCRWLAKMEGWHEDK
jgi:hypothetical protein